MRPVKQPSRPILEGLAIVAAMTVLLVLASHLPQSMHDPISPDGRFAEARR